MNTSETELKKSPRPTYTVSPDAEYETMDFHEQIEAALKAQRTKFLVILAAILACSLIGFSIVTYNYRNADNRYRDQLVAAEKYQRELTAAKADVEKLRKSTESLLNNAIPGLIPFQYNKNFEIDKKYVKRIAFDESSSKTGNNEAYQCRVTLFNQTERTVLPEMVIVFFDRNGFVVDYLHLGNAIDTNMKSAALKPNEKRTDISEVIEIPDPDRKPIYFIVDVK